MLSKENNTIHNPYLIIAVKHLGRYTVAFAYRINRRLQLDRMIERVAYVTCRTTPLPIKLGTIAEIHA